MSNDTMEYTEEDFKVLNRVFLIAESSLALLSFILNCTVIIIFLTSVVKKKLKLSNFVFFIQSLTDIIVTITLTISATAQLVEVTKEFHTCWVLFLEYSQFLSINTLFLVTVERFLAVKFPYIHRSFVTVKKVGCAAVVNLLVSAIPSLVSTLWILPLNYTMDSQEDEEHYLSLLMCYHITMGSITVITIICVFLCLLSSYSSIKSSFKLRMRFHLTTRYNQHARIKIEKKKERKVIKILFSMCAVYTITYIPYALARICYAPFIENVIPSFIGEGMIRTFAWFYFSTSFTDPLTTLFFKDDYFNSMFQWYKSLRRSLLSRNSSESKEESSGQLLNETQV